MSMIQNFEKAFFGGTTLETAVKETKVTLKKVYARKLGVYKGLKFTIETPKETKDYKIVSEDFENGEVKAHGNITEKQKKQLERISFCLSDVLSSCSYGVFGNGSFAKFKLKRSFNKKTSKKETTLENFWDDKLLSNQETGKTIILYKDVNACISGKEIWVKLLDSETETETIRKIKMVFEAIAKLGYTVNKAQDIEFYSLA